MKVEKRDGTDERRVLTGMIVDQTILARVAGYWSGDMFRSRYANLVGKWCVEHFEKYGEPPKGSIENRFAEWASKKRDKATAELVESFLSRLSGEYERTDVNTRFVLDLADRHFNRVKLSKLAEELTGVVELGDVETGSRIVSEFGRIDLASESAIDVLNDRDALRDAFSSKSDALITYPGALGEFFGDSLERDGFIAILSPEKRGKTFWLMDVAWRAMLQRRRTAVFQCGDLSRSQMIRRIAARAAKRPLKARTIRVPTSVTRLDRKAKSDEPEVEVAVEYEEKVFKKPLTEDETWKAFRRIADKKLQADEPVLRLSTHPAATISAKGIAAKLKGWDREGWSPDVVCIAEGSLVLTDRGLVPIENVRGCDKLWDGNEWVSHGGTVYKGVRDVITYAGITATPDHQVWTEVGWRALESCRRLGLRIAKTGTGRKEVRLGESYVAGRPRPLVARSEAGQDVPDETGVRLCSLCSMRFAEVDHAVEHQQGNLERLPEVLTACSVSAMALEQDGRQATGVPEPEKRELEELRGPGHRVPVRFGVGRLPLDSRRAGAAESDVDDRQNRKRRALRTGEHSMVYSSTELLAHPEEAYRADAPSVPAAAPDCLLCGFVSGRLAPTGHEPGTYRRPVELDPPPMRKAPVWDIVNAGPFHRFTVQNLLVHNCIDYADILAPPSAMKEPREAINANWMAMRAISQEFHCLVVTATQANAASYNARRISRSNFSEDKRKFAHVTGMFGVSQSDREKELDVTRLNWLALREREYSERRVVHVAGCRDYGAIAVRSCF